jgi:hypothetical protein
MTTQERALKEWELRKLSPRPWPTPLTYAGGILKQAEESHGKRKWEDVRAKIHHGEKVIAILRQIMREEGVRP